MPLPMPRWVMSSASHMTTAVPAVKMRMMNSTRGAVKSGMRSMSLPLPKSSAAVEQEDQAGALHDGEGDGEVTGRLGQLALADRALLAPLLELRDHRLEQLDDDRRGDVGHDPEPEDGGSGERAAREQVEEAEDAAGLVGGGDALDLVEVDPGHDDVRAEQVDGDDEQGEQDLVAEVRDLEHVPQACEHQILSSLGALPDAAVAGETSTPPKNPSGWRGHFPWQGAAGRRTAGGRP